MKRYFTLFSCVFLLCIGAHAVNFDFKKNIAAASPNVSITGRALVGQDGSVRFDWDGVYLQTEFTGGSIAVGISDTKRDFFNVFIDDVWKKRIVVENHSPMHITLAEGLSKNNHKLKLQKCTEGSQGCTTVYGFYLAAGGSMKPVTPKKRLIEIIGDSYSCGYGVDAENAQAHFQPETEDCNKAYGCILARYFDADYVLIAHSGMGIARNYGDTLQVSQNNMTDRYLKIFDMAGTDTYNFKNYRPDLVTINLGTNDYSQGNIPTSKQLSDKYIQMIQNIRNEYGLIPIICIVPHSANTKLSEALTEVRNRISSLDKVFMTLPMPNIIVDQTDLGADFHPNYQGQRKIAMTLIPQICAFMNWPLQNKVIQ